MARKQHKEISQSIRTLIDSLDPSKLNLNAIFDEISKQSDVAIKRQDFDSAVRMLESEGYLRIAADGRVRIVLHSV